MTNNKTRKRIVTAAIALGAFAGSGMIASAVTSTQATPAAPTAVTAPAAVTTPAANAPVEAQSTNEANDANEATEVHTGKGPADRAAHEAQEATDGTDAKLLAAAKITPDQAKAAAIALVPGTADTPDIHDRGTLSYRVNITNGTIQTEVSVDATTGVATLDQGRGGHGGHHGNDGPEQNEANETTPGAPLGSLLPGQ
jgi:uncharacterized membrane protein YkoI